MYTVRVQTHSRTGWLTVFRGGYEKTTESLYQIVFSSIHFVTIWIVPWYRIWKYRSESYAIQLMRIDTLIWESSAYESEISLNTERAPHYLTNQFHFHSVFSSRFISFSPFHLISIQFTILHSFNNKIENFL